MSGAARLYQLQLVDSERDDARNRLAEVEASLGETGDLRRAREAVSETDEGLKRLRSQLRALDLDVSAVSAKLKKNQERLYSGRVRNPKELASLQDEARALRRRMAELEDEQLELMIAIEQEEAELAERQARLRQIEAAWRQDQADLQAEKERLEQKLTELEEERGQMRAGLRAANLDEYDELRRRYGGIGVALLKGGICQMCGVDVPTQVARAVERGEGVRHCPVCNRLLASG
jgi:predicted  nucleic acid-binding Zn-ribbon protein